MDVISDKIDASLQLALQLPTEELEKSGSLSAGYEKESQSWELILRLAGSVQTLRQAFPQASFQELSGGYVTALVPEDAIEALAAQDSVIYIEQPKRIVTGVAQGVRASCIWPLQQEMTPVGPLSGRGIFVAIIDSGIIFTRIFAMRMEAAGSHGFLRMEKNTVRRRSIRRWQRRIARRHFL